VIGSDRLGLRIGEQLERDGLAVTLVAVPGSWLCQAKLPAHWPVVRAEPDAPGVLEQAGLARSEALLAVSDRDELNLGAVLQLDGGMLRVFPAGGDFLRSQPLRLKLLHPNRQDADVTLALAPDELGWHVAHAADAGHDWIVQLSDASPGNDASWRLRGRLPRGQRATHLGPALDAR